MPIHVLGRRFSRSFWKIWVREEGKASALALEKGSGPSIAWLRETFDKSYPSFEEPCFI